MKKLLSIVAVLGVVLGLGALNVSAQLDSAATGPRSPGALTKYVELFNGCESLVVSFDGTARTRLVTSGRGVLTGVNINSTSEGSATTVPWRVSFYDAASLSDVTLASTSLGNAAKIVEDQIGGPLPYAVVSVGGSFTTTSNANVRPNTVERPVQFNNGIVIENGSAANHGSMGIYWIK